jgi:hypothetical protein
MRHPLTVMRPKAHLRATASAASAVHVTVMAAAAVTARTAILKLLTSKAVTPTHQKCKQLKQLTMQARLHKPDPTSGKPLLHQMLAIQ